MLLRSKHRLDKLAGKAEEEEAKIRGLTEIRQNYIIRWHVQTPFPGGQGHINIVTSCEASMVWYGLKWSTPKVECSRKILSALCGAVLYPTSKPQGCRCCWGKGAKVRREAVGSFSLRWSKPEAAFRALAPGSGEFEIFGELSRKPGYFYFPSFSHQTYYDLLYYVCIQRLNQSSDSMRAWEHGSSFDLNSAGRDHTCIWAHMWNMTYIVHQLGRSFMRTSCRMETKLFSYEQYTEEQLRELHDGNSQSALQQLGKHWETLSTTGTGSDTDCESLEIMEVVWNTCEVIVIRCPLRPGWPLIWTPRCNQLRATLQLLEMICARFLHLGLQWCRASTLSGWWKLWCL